MALTALLGAGAMLGLSTNLAKVAWTLGLDAPTFLFWSVAGAAMILLVLSGVRGRLPPVTKRTATYFVIAAFLTVAGSNLLLYSAVAQVGVSFVVLALTLPPVMTYIGALTLGLEQRCRLRFAGIVFAFAGSGYMAVRQLQLPDVDALWIGLTLLGPVLLAGGNLYRTLRWPDRLAPDHLAPGMMVAATALIGAAALLPGITVDVPDPTWAILGLIAGQSVVFALQFLLVFVLQKSGGPVMLSLFGSVAAIVGIPFAVFALGETLPPGLMIGGIAIAIGVSLMAAGQSRLQD